MNVSAHINLFTDAVVSCVDFDNYVIIQEVVLVYCLDGLCFVHGTQLQIEFLKEQEKKI